MISADGGRKMPCEGCGVQFSVFRRKRVCAECDRQYCAACLRRGGGLCVPCRALCTRPLVRAAIAGLKPRDLQCFLHRQNVSTRGCVEKEELVSLCISHVNGPSYRRRGGASGAGGGGGVGGAGCAGAGAGGGGGGGARVNGAFSTLRGLTADINNFFSSTFDMRPPFPTSQDNCYNSAHAHAEPSAARAAGPPPRHERFTINPGGERDCRVPPPAHSGRDGRGVGGASDREGSMSRSSSGPRADTADCFEVEDLDDGWELLSPPADPLPGDSEVLLTASEQRVAPAPRPASAPSAPPAASPAPPAPADGTGRGLLSPGGCGGAGGVGTEWGPSTPQRAASELELSRSESANTADSASLQDEPLMGYDNNTSEPEPEPASFAFGGEEEVSLEALASEAALDALPVRELKRLLARNRVEFRGCLERADLLARARTLYRDYHKYRDAVDALPIEECCKICMAAPLECVLLECGHIAACTRCAKQLAECPICRQYVVRAVRFFRS